MHKERRFVIDTSLFTNPNARKGFGDSTIEAVKNFLKIASKTSHLKFYMPVSIKKELKTFLNDEEIPFLEAIVTVKSPALYELQVPAAVVYKLIDEIRDRINKGLRVTEKILRSEKEDLSNKIHYLRQRYREALRDGVIDSKEDFDVLMLAKEVDAIVVTADKGLMKMAEWLGIAFFEAERFYELLSYEAKVDSMFLNQST